MASLSVRVTDSFDLHAGHIRLQRDRTIILPPDPAMFAQLIEWLGKQSAQDKLELNHTIMGIGATGLCLRWGTYLAVLLDESKPIDPRAKSTATSMISDQEMKRINLEFSANLARVLQMLREDERGCGRLLQLSYQHLPMPQGSVKVTAEFLHPFMRLTSLEFWNSASADLQGPTTVSDAETFVLLPTITRISSSAYRLTTK